MYLLAVESNSGINLNASIWISINLRELIEINFVFRGFPLRNSL